MIYVFLGLIILVVLILSLNDKTTAPEEELNVVDEDLINKVNPIKAITVKGVQYEVHTGPNGGMYYFNNGKKHYLTTKQQKNIYEL
jgi:hypothetical protein